MDRLRLDWITNFIWSIADDVLRDIYVRGKYRDITLPTITTMNSRGSGRRSACRVSRYQDDTLGPPRTLEIDAIVIE